MSPKKKLLIYYGIWFAPGLTLMWLAINIDSIFIIPLFGLMFAIGSLSMMIKCPNCGNKLMVKSGLSGMPIAVRGWLPDKCPDCGKNIS